MLQNQLFTFTGLQVTGDTIITNIQLNPAHPIFSGHFPGQPVLPGVCMMQIVKKVLETHINHTTRLVKAGGLKFLSVVTPAEGKLISLELKIQLEGGQIKADAKLTDDEIIVFKFKGVFEKTA